MALAAQRGAYGVALQGLLERSPLLLDAPADWATARWEHATAAGAAARGVRRITTTSPDGALLDVTADPPRCTLVSPVRPDDRALVHPWLSTVAAYWAWARGDVTLHGAVVEVDGRAWAVLGEKESGKSTLTAWCGLAGLPSGGDDLVVVHSGDRVLCGPAAVDLRAPAAARLGVGDRVELVPGRVRWRLDVARAAPVLPLAGFVVPGWGAEALAPVPLPARFAALARNTYVRDLRGRERDVLRLVGLPVLQWTRPRDLDLLDATATRLVAALRAH